MLVELRDLKEEAYDAWHIVCGIVPKGDNLI